MIPQSEYIIIYVHGGGFASGSTAGCANYLLQLAAELHRKGPKCSVLSVEYDLSPEAQYPTALRQISAAYSYGLGLRKPVILVGDSAGGHLCLSLLRHIHIPHPKIHQVIGSTAPELLILVSPWVDLKNERESVQRNGVYDCIQKSVLDRWSRQYLGDIAQLDFYTDHLGEKSPWNSLLPEKSLVIAGELECFLSEINELAEAVVRVSANPE
jgi:acetyl esterase/lipase